MQEDLQRLIALVAPLDEDIRLIGDSLSVLDGRALQSMRRAYVRAAFARIEAFVFALKQLTIERANSNGIELSTRDREVLAEISSKHNTAGEIIIAHMYPKLSESLKTTFRVLCHVLQLDYNLDHGGGWSALLASVVVRNRITHPKVTDELQITEEEIKYVEASLKWLDIQWTNIGFLHHKLAIERAGKAGKTDEDIATYETMGIQDFHDNLAELTRRR
jgi:hypothetical protein